jgi:acetate kinase
VVGTNRAPILVVNAGSTSLKLSVVDVDGASTSVESLATVPDGVAAAAHRIVHGGARLTAPVIVDGPIEAELASLVELAPLHNAPALAALDEARRTLPAIPHIAVFDSAFHATQPEEARLYAVPERWREEWGIRRYGFHGLSVQWAAERVRAGRLVVCHLGGGCSVTAVQSGVSVETTMGFSPLEGVPMATRSGSIDAEIVLHLLRTGRLGVEQIEDALEQESGLLGLSGISARVEELERSADPAAKLALAVFARRVAGAVGSAAVALDGLDALVFTGGVGERSASVRSAVCRRLRFLGVHVDEIVNGRLDGGGEIAAPASAVRVTVVEAREDVVAARAARSLL